MVYTFIKNGNIWERFFVMHQYWFDGYSWEESLANHRWVKSDVEDPLNFFSRQVVSFDNPPIYLGAIMAGYEIKHSNSIRTKEGGGGGFQESRARPLHLPNTITNVIEKLNMEYY